MPNISSDSMLPAEFAQALDSVRQAKVRTEIVVNEIPAPQNLAPQAVAFSADVLPANHGEDSEHGTSRLVFLYDPAQPKPWEGSFRVVAYAHAPLDVSIGNDEFLASVAWSWLTESLTSHGAQYRSISGTATKIISTGFGGLAHQGDGAKIELRASWTPTNYQLGRHLSAWGDVVALFAGLPPTPGAESLTVHRNNRANR